MTANGEHRFGPAYEVGIKELCETIILDRDLTDDEVRSLLEDIPESSTLVQTPETSSLNRPVNTYRSRFMHGKEVEYAATLETYHALSSPTSMNHVHALEDCRKFAQFAREKMTGEVRVMGSSCRDRWCPMCAGQKASYAKDQAKMYIDAMTKPKLLTLTLRNDGNDLKNQLEFLTMSFRTLRQRAYWKRNVSGGLWFLQVKRGSGSGCWHPHLHILVDSDYMEQERLSMLWEQVTFGSPVIDIRQIYDSEDVSSYVARYCARPAVLKDMPLVDRIEVIESLHAKRLCGTFGTGKSVTLTPPKIKDDCEWSTIGWYDEIMKQSRTNPQAREIVRAYFNDECISEDLFESFTGHPVNVEVPPMELRENVELFLDFYNS